MRIPFVDRDPTQVEVEKLRLILSTYQDGTGQQVVRNGRTLPGWRDFERTVAAAFGGEPQESKFIFDVLIPDPNRDGVFYGISCKMRRTLDETYNRGKVTIELSNSAGKFWQNLQEYGLDQTNYRESPQTVGKALITMVEKWHKDVEINDRGRRIDLEKSFYLALSWKEPGEYQLFKFALKLPNPENLIWDFPNVKQGGLSKPGRRLTGKDKPETILFEWYGESGGQLKYYPLVKHALWKSDPFSLEPLPENDTAKYGILAKAQVYFPQQWEKILRGKNYE